MKKRILSLVLAAAMVLSLAACGGKENPSDATQSGNGNVEQNGERPTYTFRDYQAALATNWNPHTWEMNADDAVLVLVTTPLVNMSIKDSVNQIYQWTYDAATYVKDVTADHTDDLTKYDCIIADGETAAEQKEGYVFEIGLNPDMKWENGTPINADTYIYSMQQFLNPDMKNYRANNFYSGDYQVAGGSKYFFSKDAGLYVAASDLENLDNLYLDVATFWNTDNTYVDANGNVAPQYIKVTDETVYGESIGDAFSAKGLYEDYASYFADGSYLYNYQENADFGATYDAVGFYKVDDYTVRYVCDKPADINYLLGHFSSGFLVYEDLYEKCKTQTGDLITSNYGTSMETTMSYGPYKLSSFQDGKQMVFTQNENWFYEKQADGSLKSMTSFEVDGAPVQQYQTETYIIDVMDDDAAKQAFLKGQLTSWVPSADDLVTYSLSDQLYRVDETYTERFFFNTDLEALKKMDQSEGNKNSVVMSNVNFRKAFSFAIDRNEWVGATAGWKPACFLMNTLYHYDIYNDPSSSYRSSEPAMAAICDLYGVEYGEGTIYKDVKAAYESITGYNLTEAKNLMKQACDELVQAGLYKAGDDIVIKIAWAKGALTAADTKQCTLIESYLNAAAEGSGFGKIKLEQLGNIATRYSDVPSGKYAIGFGAWGGAAFYPFTMFRVYMDPDYAALHEGACYDPATETLTLNINGEDVTMTWQQWSNATSGTNKYAKADMQTKLQITALLEEAFLKQYYCIPLATTANCSMLSYQAKYYTQDYNIMYGFGEMRLLTYNYSDAEWADYVASQGGTLSYE